MVWSFARVQQSPKTQNGKLTAHCSIPFHLKAAIRSNPCHSYQKKSNWNSGFWLKPCRRWWAPCIPFQENSSYVKCRAESCPWNQEELQISKEENHKERSLFLLPEWRQQREWVQACNPSREGSLKNKPELISNSLWKTISNPQCENQQSCNAEKSPNLQFDSYIDIHNPYRTFEFLGNEWCLSS